MANKKMPVVFAGHGSPLNAILDNRFSREWRAMGAELPKPEKILAISAHWNTHGSLINSDEYPEQIYDMYGFPDELYQLRYDAPGSPELAARVRELAAADVSVNNDWGIDHGVWSILHQMYPEADVPIVQLSVNADAEPEELFQIGKSLKPLRDEGVMIFASGDIVHNLGMVNWELDGCYDWAEAFDNKVTGLVTSGGWDQIVDYHNLSPDWRRAIPTPEHFVPLIYALGAADKEDKVTIRNQGGELGSITMTSFVFE